MVALTTASSGVLPPSRSNTKLQYAIMCAQVLVAFDCAWIFHARAAALRVEASAKVII